MRAPLRSSFLLALYSLLVFGPVAYGLTRLLDPDAREAVSSLLDQMDLPALLANSLFLALLTTLFAIALGLPIALVLGTRRFPGRSFLTLLLLVPILIPPHIHTIAWARVIGDRGWLTGLLKEWTGWAPNIRAALGDPATDPLLGHLYPGPAWVMACAYFPLITLPVLAGIRGMSQSGMEAARLLGHRQVIRRIVLPQIGNRLLSGATFVFILALSTYPVVSLLDTPTLIQKVFFALNQSLGQQVAALTLGLPLVLAAGLAVFGLCALESHQASGTQTRLLQPMRGSCLWGLVPLGLLILAMGVSLGSLILEAGPLRLTGGAPDNYQMVFDRVREAFFHSLLICTVAVGALLVLGVAVGRALAGRRSLKTEGMSLSLLGFPPEIIGLALLAFATQASRNLIPQWFFVTWAVLVATPLLISARHRPKDIVLGAGLCGGMLLLFFLLTRTEIFATIQQRGITLVVLAYLCRFLPMLGRLFRNGFERLDPDEASAARLLGRGSWSRFVRLELPQTRFTVLTAFVLAWVLCWTELPATLVTLRPGWQTVQMRIFNMVHYQSIGEVSALCVLSILAALVPVVLLLLIVDRKGATS